MVDTIGRTGCAEIPRGGLILTSNGVDTVNRSKGGDGLLRLPSTREDLGIRVEDTRTMDPGGKPEKVTTDTRMGARLIQNNQNVKS